MNDNEYPLGEDPTDEEKFYIDWGRETLKNSILRINDLQKTLMTISISMLGGSLAFYNIMSLPDSWKKASLIMLLISVIVNAFSTFHGDSLATTNNAAKIKEEKEAVKRKKYFWYRVSFVSLIIPLAIVLVGTFMSIA